MRKKFISASILAADFAHLGDEIKHALSAGVDYIHFDVMDHHFVPNLSFGAPICHSLRKAGITAPIDVHLMVDNPQDFIPSFAQAGANLMTFHPETVESVESVLKAIKAAGMQAGLAFNPDRAVQLSKDVLRDIDLILLMSVFPGFAGQSFVTGSIEKIARTRDLLDKAQSNAMLGIDGGIKVANIGEAAQAGADFFVVGSGLFHASDYQRAISEMRQKIQSCC